MATRANATSSSRAALNTIRGAVQAIEQALNASQAVADTFGYAHVTVLETIEPLLPSVTNPADQLVVDGLLREMASAIGQPEPWVTPKGKTDADASDPSATLSSRTARDTLRAAFRILIEHVEQQRMQMDHYRDLLQAALDAIHAARQSVTDQTDQAELQGALSKLDTLLGPWASKELGFLRVLNDSGEVPEAINDNLNPDADEVAEIQADDVVRLRSRAVH